MRQITVLFFLFASLCAGQAQEVVKPGAACPDKYMSALQGRNIALVANQGSLVDGVHLVDTLLMSGIDTVQIKCIFSPEHGFRGDRGAGEIISDQVDPLTGISIISLYGENKKPFPGQMAGLDLVVFDLQDVGVRFYTYISTLHYVMEACAENGVPLLVLDRPNPNGSYVDGPVLDTAFRSFVGMHPIPVVYGMSMGELARMINGEGWLSGGQSCKLEVVPCEGYRHSSAWSLPVPPSPNLANDHAIQLYPSTCFFEGTLLSEGRGTPWPFEVYGHPDLPGDFVFIPESIPGVAPHPKWEGKQCRGRDLRSFSGEKSMQQIHLEFLLAAYRDFPDQDSFFMPFFDKLAGGSELREQIGAGRTEEEIRRSWKKGLRSFSKKRSKYLLYHD